MTDDSDLWNEEYEEEIESTEFSSLVVYSRDWTVETIFSQIQKKNIDLEPKFQRRNAWNDHKRSKLIESLITRLPVPQIVLAEDKDKKGAFVVIDGKQRLLALSGFLEPTQFPFWKNPILTDLKTRPELNGLSIGAFKEKEEHKNDWREFLNADIRCTIITGYKSDQVLYDIFYRLNSGSVPLSSQELRQVLIRGELTSLVMEETNKKIPLHDVMGLSGPDSRLRDAEILLRYIAFRLRGDKYNGNLSSFLDETLRHGNKNWLTEEKNIRTAISEFHAGTQLVLDIMPEGKAGRKFVNGRWETRFNRVLLEVEIYYFIKIGEQLLKSRDKEFMKEFAETLGKNKSFIESIESTTKTIERYYTRFSEFEKFVNSFFGTSINSVPTPNPSN